MKPPFHQHAVPLPLRGGGLAIRHGRCGGRARAALA